MDIQQAGHSDVSLLYSQKSDFKNIIFRTSRTFQIKLNFQEIFEQPRALAEAYWENGISERLTAFSNRDYTIKLHWTLRLQMVSLKD